MRNAINVIASEAKQSIFLSSRGKMDCFAALAMTVSISLASSCLKNESLEFIGCERRTHHPYRHHPQRRMIQYSGASVIGSKRYVVLDPRLRGDDNLDRSGAVRYRTRRLSRIRLFVVLLLAADRLQLGEHRIDIEIVALLFARFVFRLFLGG